MRVWCIDGQSADMNAKGICAAQQGVKRTARSAVGNALCGVPPARRREQRALAGMPDTATGRRIVTQDINVLALVKGEERYIFLYDDEHKSEALRTLGRFASNPELSFSWYDAAVLSQRIRQTAMEQRAEAEAETETAAPASPRHSRFKLPLAE